MPISPNPITVAYEEITDPAKSPIERFSLDEGFFATRVLQCQWSERFTLASQLLKGYTISVLGFSYVYGQRYPHVTGCFVKRVSSIEPWGQSGGDSNGDATWPLARLTVEYEPLAFDPQGASSSEGTAAEIVYEEDFDVTAEFMTLPNKKLYWDSAMTDPIEDAEAPGFLVRMKEWTATFTTQDAIPTSVDTFTGTVNSAAVTSKTLGITFPAETLLYRGPKVHHQRLSDGSDLYRVQLQFTARPYSWNKFYRSGLQVPVDIYEEGSSGGAFKPYPLSDFTQLYV